MGNLLIYFLLTVTLVLGEDDGSFIFSTGKLEVKLNNEVHLDCGIKGEYRYCVWEHGNDIFKVEEVYEDKYPGKSEPWNTYNNQCGIVLNRVSSEDYGKWTCKIFIIGGSHAGSKNVVPKSESDKVTTIGTTKYSVSSTKSKGTTTPKASAIAVEPGMSGGEIAGIVISCLVLVAAVVAAVVSIMYLKKEKKHLLCFDYTEVKQSPTS